VDSAPSPHAGAAKPTTRSRRWKALLALPFGALALSGCTVSGFGAYPGNTTQARSTFHLWQGFTIAALIVGGFVVLLIVWAVLRYRRTGDEIPKQTQYHLPLEITYTVIPILIVIGLFVATIVVENQVTANPKPAATIDVDAFQWGWQFLYPHTNALVVGQTTSEPMFEMPVGEPVRFFLQSSDVTHGWYVRSFDFSRLAVPGVDNEWTMTALKTGVFFGQCTELCGLYHSLMWFRVDVVTPAQFTAWEARFNTKTGAAAAEAAALATQQGTSAVIPVHHTTTSGQ
jgi:cytochrome c oxidase subunit II